MFVTPVHWDGNFCILSRVAVPGRCFWHYFNPLRCCVFAGRILLCCFFFVQKLCADRFRSQNRRVIEFVFYHEIAQSKVEVQTQYMSGHDRCSFHDFFFILVRRLVTLLSTFVSAYVLFPCLLRARCGNFLWSLPFIALFRKPRHCTLSRATFTVSFF